MSYKDFFYLFLLSLALSTSADAHQSALSYLELQENSDLSIEMRLKRPSEDIDSDDLRLELPRVCEDILPLSIYQEERFTISKRHLWCSAQGIKGESLWVTDLLESDKGVVFTFNDSDGNRMSRLITASDPHVLIAITDDSKSPTSAYLWLGIEHILLGIDHLLFVLALLLLVSGLKTLVQTITAFTVAHSITLGLAAVAAVEFSVTYIEAMIALSIIFLARELLLGKERGSWTYTYPSMVAFTFGLLHGLGFASALAEIGLPEEDIALALLFFNLGVELGQLLFIFVVISLIHVIQDSVIRHHVIIRTSTIYLIGITASYWFIERSLILF